MREIESLAELKTLVGQVVAVSDWIRITQEQVNQFAEATGDRQWIHVDVERSRAESPFGGTVAHGFLTLSLVSAMLEGTVSDKGVKTLINYGLNKVRFPAPVPVGSRVRGHIQLLSVEDVASGAQINWQVTVEREGGEKPVCVAEVIVREYG